MGLDMYAYVAAREGQNKEYWDSGEYDPKTGDYVNAKVTKPIKIAYWRKHLNLHGWMERLWRHQGNEGDFNGDELELTWEDIDHLEQDIEASGFFWGDPSDDYYYEDDLKFIREARSQLFLGLRLFYNSSW